MINILTFLKEFYLHLITINSFYFDLQIFAIVLLEDVVGLYAETVD